MLLNLCPKIKNEDSISQLGNIVVISGADLLRSVAFINESMLKGGQDTKVS